MSDDEKSIDNKTIIKIIIAIVISLGVQFSNFGEKEFIAFIAVVICAILIGLYFYQGTCSDYQCPDGYVKNESKKDTECDSLTCDSNDKDTCCNSKQKCSEYTCPTGYDGKDNSDKIYCKDSVCKESDDKDTCCNKSVNCEGSWSDFGECSVTCGGGTQTRAYTVTTQPQYGGTPCPDTLEESQPCNTQACASGVVANATCSTVSVDCPDGYLYKTDSAAAECSGPTCDVVTGGVDLGTCCEQGCTSPGSIPTGYTGNLPAILPVGVGDITGVSCDTNYHGTPQSNCNTPGGEYTLDGCDPYMCTQPSDITGYNITNVTSLERHNFSVDVECADGYGSSTTAVAQAQMCDSNGEPYSLTGCENKTGFCSGNYDSSNDVLCPTGYNDKYDKDTIVGDTLDTCCDPWTCSIPLPQEAYNITLDGATISDTISYSDIDRASVSCKASARRTIDELNISCNENEDGNHIVNLLGCENAPIDCAFTQQNSECLGDCGGTGTQTITYNVTTQSQYGGTPCPTTEEIPCDTRACATCSSYQCPEDYIPKSDVAEVSCGNYDCNIGNRDTCCEVGQLPEEQDTELPFCSEVVQRDKLPSTTFSSTIANNLQECSDLCIVLPTCQSFGYSETSGGRRFNNCFLGSSITTGDPQGTNDRDIFSWSFYPKCQHRP